jgi:hypothetical protein
VRAACPLLLLAALAQRAAADEKEFLLAVQPGFSLIHVGDQTAWGGGAGVDFAYGVTDALAVRATGAFTGQAIGEAKMNDQVTAPSGTVLSYFAGVGVTYTIDVLRVVPYIDFAVGALGTRRPTLQGDAWGHDFGIEIGLGLDYLVNRRFAVGVVVRYHAFLTAIADLPVYLYAGPRLAVHFGG